MKVWLLTIGEPVPLKNGLHDRLHRTGAFATYLARNGHEVLWWTSTFDHFRKRHVLPADSTLQTNDHLTIKLLHGSGYSKNVSLARIRDHRQVAKKFSILSRHESSRPDIIVAALPTIELCVEAVKYGREFGVPVVLDMRDMWPDIFLHAMPAFARPILRLPLIPLYRQARLACSGATFISGITDEFVGWGLARGNRQRRSLDLSFPFVVTVDEIPEERLKSAEKFWDDLGVMADGQVKNICFVGTIGVHTDHKMFAIIESAKDLNRAGVAARFVICGDGDRLDFFRRLAAGMSNLIFPGWVGNAEMRVLMSRSIAGLNPLPDRYDFLATINNKAIEYLSAGLPVISSPQRGVLFDLLTRYKCGVSYDPGDSASLSHIVKALVSDPGLRSSLAAHSKNLFASRFSSDNVHAQMTDYLGRVIREYCRK